ncbi:chemotaxis protein CheD [Camelliibacillus cellulosilyticus]|uniref:Probable chemoreceptor glutamine deamidase CheD n=1 Tax=Camelliibacillus cellulosilyticus TaxID=2174486 RepID=A0ABV9GJU0_9BACL
MDKIIRVGIADWKLARRPEALRTSGLGSCVAVVIYDSSTGLAAMAHIMLPNHELTKQANFSFAKFADTAIPALVDILLKKGAYIGRLKAKIAGGAEMFRSRKGFTSGIGKRNVAVAKEYLKQYKIPIISEDTGGDYGRTIEFFTETDMMCVRSIKRGERMI